MKRITFALILLFLVMAAMVMVPSDSNAAAVTYTVQSGDSLWKIAVKYQVGVSELISLNPQLKNPNLIYVGEKIYIPATPEITAVEKEVARLVNVERAKNGLPALAYNWQLARVARIKSEDMKNNNYFSHTSPTYGSPFTMMRSFGISYTAAGENIAMGQRTAAEVMNGWMNSPGHRSNILNSSFTQIGVGYAKDSYGRGYWTQQFIRP
ncbi:MAG: SafA/ExsA family spore coat assembly protein [Ignavibacteriales bacterium]